jgi:hypothetical protein
MKNEKCQSCSNSSTIFSWWFLLGTYLLVCGVKVTIDIVKYLISLI